MTIYRVLIAASIAVFWSLQTPVMAQDPSTESCQTIRPGPDWTCANGNWYPPGFPIPPAPPPPNPLCPTIQPGPDWTCVNGNWLPPGIPIPGEPPDPDPVCTTAQPGPDWACFDGNWLPPGITGSCNTAFVTSSQFPATEVIVPPEGGAVQVLVLVEPVFSCRWSAFSENSWITVTFPRFPTFAAGDGDLFFTVEPNTSGVERIGTIQVAEKVLFVIQPAR